MLTKNKETRHLTQRETSDGALALTVFIVLLDFGFTFWEQVGFDFVSAAMHDGKKVLQRLSRQRL